MPMSFIMSKNKNNNNNNNNQHHHHNQVINVACPFDTRIAENEHKKIDHYQELKVEIQKM